jgi:hypothetical protein
MRRFYKEFMKPNYTTVNIREVQFIGKWEEPLELDLSIIFLQQPEIQNFMGHCD